MKSISHEENVLFINEFEDVEKIAALKMNLNDVLAIIEDFKPNAFFYSSFQN